MAFASPTEAESSVPDIPQKRIIQGRRALPFRDRVNFHALPPLTENPSPTLPADCRKTAGPAEARLP